MRLVVVTGMSGAGKSIALKFLEDIGFYCVDNLPPALIPKFAEICLKSVSDIDKIALGIDIRGGALFNDLIPALDAISDENYECYVLYLDSNNDTLLKRFKETRRVHPLAKSERLGDAILEERRLTESIKQRAAHVIDTSYLLPRDLKAKINEIFLLDTGFSGLIITVLSFGFKYGLPVDSDIVFDVRFTPNPFYIPELKELTGNDSAVSRYVLSHDVSKVFLKQAIEMIEFLIPYYISEGKNRLIISFGCTGGKHRSVSYANALCEYLQKKGHSAYINHRDIATGG